MKKAGRPSDRERVKAWQGRIVAANKAHKEWSDKYKCDLLEEYYLGHQWSDQEEQRENYTINKFYSRIEARLPSLLYYYPHIKVSARPARADDPGSDATDRAKLQQDTVNTFVQDERVGFYDEVALALKEAFWRFGVIEVGYSADFIDNPLAEKPELLTEDEKDLASVPKVFNPDNPEPETIYVKRIPAKQFRFPVNGKNALDRNDWYGYWEWQYLEDVKQNPNYKNTNELEAGGKVKKQYDDETEEDSLDPDANSRRRAMIKVWKIWDLRKHRRYVFADNATKFLVDGEPFGYAPHAVLKFHEILDNAYPMPACYNWLSPQNELNETREMQRVHRKRFYRRYTYQDGAIDESELRKLEDGGDGVYARANRQDPIQPVPDAPLDPAVVRNIPLTNQDLTEITGVSDEMATMAQPETTATQANIVDVRSRIRESFQRMQVSRWLGRVGWLMLKFIKDNMALPFWIKINVDPTGPQMPAEAMRVSELWRQITSEQLGDIYYDVTADMQSLSPVTEEQERQNWTQVLAMLTNPSLVLILMASDAMLRKTLSYFNIRSDKDIENIRAAMQQILAIQAAMAQGQGGRGPGTPAPPGPGATPDNAGISMQLDQQMGVQ